MSFNIKIERGNLEHTIIADSKILAIKHKVKDILDDISDALASEAGYFAPESDPEDHRGVGSAGDLRAHPVDTYKSGFGQAVNFAREAEGFRSVRGEGGRFVRGKASSSDFGHIFYKIVTTYPSHPFYAKYVAFGSGPRAAFGSFPYGKDKIYTPNHKLITSLSGKPMKFSYKGRGFKLDYTKGQHPNPYLDEATRAVNRTYIPIKIGELRAMVSAIT